ncbi:hypothetical protein C8J56DRAFT_904229 [Mycena floridula]|nr:hypothetical protein C8J56DRAFT_904229 [Mycena floridula]
MTRRKTLRSLTAANSWSLREVTLGASVYFEYFSTGSYGHQYFNVVSQDIAKRAYETVVSTSLEMHSNRYPDIWRRLMLKWYQMGSEQARTLPVDTNGVDTFGWKIYIESFEESVWHPNTATNMDNLRVSTDRNEKQLCIIGVDTFGWKIYIESFEESVWHPNTTTNMDNLRVSTGRTQPPCSFVGGPGVPEEGYIAFAYSSMGRRCPARLTEDFVWARKGRTERLVSASDASNPLIAVPAAAVFTILGRVSPVNFFTGMTGNVLAIDGVRVLEKAKYTLQLVNHIKGHADFDFIRVSFLVFQRQISKSSRQEDFICNDRFRFTKDVFTLLTWTGPLGLAEHLEKMKSTRKVNRLTVLDLEGLPVAPFDVQDEIDGQVVEIDFHFTHNYIKSANKDNFMAEMIEIRMKVEVDEEYEAMKPKKLAPVFEARVPEVLVKDKDKESGEFKTKLRGETEDKWTAPHKVGSDTSTVELESTLETVADTHRGSDLGPNGSVSGSSAQGVQDVQEVALETEGAAGSRAQLGGTEQDVLPSTRSSGRNSKWKASDVGGQGGTDALKKIRIVPLTKAR